MFRQLLQAVQRGEAVAPPAIARRLGVSEPLVRLMLDDLAALGYLARPGAVPGDAPTGAAACATPCDGCPLSTACPGSGSGVWVVTAEGRRLLSRT